MRVRELTRTGRRVLVAVCDKGEEAVSAVTATAAEYGIVAAQLTAVGGLQGGELGYYDRTRRDYARIPVCEQVEVLSLVGDIARHGDRPQVHAHVVLGRSDGSTFGGHLLSGRAWPTLEVMITEVGPELTKRFDPETGLALLTP